MRILAVCGSPKPSGNTVAATKLVEIEMRQIDPSVEFEYLHLRESELKPCLGCYACLSDGEDRCPLRDDRAAIERKMHEADAVIFNTPVYLANVSGLYKTFLDRFSYIAHRPRFHEKQAMAISSTGSVAGGFVNILQKVALETWGFEVSARFAAIVSPGITQRDRTKQERRNRKGAARAAKRFHRSITDERPPRATFQKLFAFTMQKIAFRYADPEKADFNYWRDQGWLKKGQRYYIKARINPFTYGFAWLLGNMTSWNYPKGQFRNREDLGT